MGNARKHKRCILNSQGSSGILAQLALVLLLPADGLQRLKSSMAYVTYISPSTTIRYVTTGECSSRSDSLNVTEAHKLALMSWTIEMKVIFTMK